MIYLNVVLNVKDPANIDRVRGLLQHMAIASRAEPGCERFEIYHSDHEPSTFLLVERWASQAALDQHRLAKAFTEHYAPLVIPLVDRSPHPSTLLE